MGRSETRLGKPETRMRQSETREGEPETSGNTGHVTNSFISKLASVKIGCKTPLSSINTGFREE